MNLQRETADDARSLAHEVVATVRHCEKIRVRGVPTESGDLLPLRALRAEAPQGEQATFAVSVRITRIFPVFEVLKDFVLCILVDHTL